MNKRNFKILNKRMDLRIKLKVWEANHQLKMQKVYNQDDEWIDPKDDRGQLRVLIKDQKKEERWDKMMTRSEYMCEIDLR